MRSIVYIVDLVYVDSRISIGSLLYLGAIRVSNLCWNLSMCLDFKRSFFY